MDLAEPVVGKIVVQPRNGIGGTNKDELPGPAPARPEFANREILPHRWKLFEDVPLRQIDLVGSKRIHVRPVQKERFASLYLFPARIRKKTLFSTGPRALHLCAQVREAFNVWGDR